MKSTNCYCCENKSTVEHKQTMRIDFCNEHSIIDFYKKQVVDFELKQLEKARK